MTLIELTNQATEEHANKFICCPSNGMEEDIKDDFIAGANWERNREKWISVKDHLPEPLQTVWLSNGEGWTTLGCRSAILDGLWCWAQTNGIIYEENDKIISECESDDLDVNFWQPLPEPPKQKED